MQRQYHEKSYWEGRYEAEPPEHTYDWYVQYEGRLRELVHDRVRKDADILMIGSGNSIMPEVMNTEGFTSIIATDYVPVVVERMQTRCAGTEGLTFEVQDARKMSYPDGAFDVVIDKGTLDASDMGPTNLRQIVGEARRVLRPRGLFFVVSITPPFVRKPFLRRPEYGWDWDEERLLGGPTPAYAFMMALQHT